MVFKIIFVSEKHNIYRKTITRSQKAPAERHNYFLFIYAVPLELYNTMTILSINISFLWDYFYQKNISDLVERTGNGIYNFERELDD